MRDSLFVQSSFLDGRLYGGALAARWVPLGWINSATAETAMKLLWRRFSEIRAFLGFLSDCAIGDTFGH
jgi:hypothetical protein